MNRWTVDVVWDALNGTAEHPGYFGDPTLAGLGAVGVMNIDYEPDGPKFLFRLFDNPGCRPQVRLPTSALSEYRQTAELRPDEALTVEVLRELCPPEIPTVAIGDGLAATGFHEFLLAYPDDVMTLSQAEMNRLMDAWRAGHRPEDL